MPIKSFLLAGIFAIAALFTFALIEVHGAEVCRKRPVAEERLQWTYVVRKGHKCWHRIASISNEEAAKLPLKTEPVQDQAEANEAMILWVQYKRQPEPDPLPPYFLEPPRVEPVFTPWMAWLISFGMLAGVIGIIGMIIIYTMRIK